MVWYHVTHSTQEGAIVLQVIMLFFFPEPPALHVVEHKQRNLTLFSTVLPAAIQHADKLPLTHDTHTAPPPHCTLLLLALITLWPSRGHGGGQ